MAQKNLRLDDDGKEQLDQAIADIKGNDKNITENDAIKVIVAGFYEARKLTKMPGRKDEIMTLVRHLEGIKNLFMGSLDIAYNAKQTAEEEFNKRLQVSNQTIADLQAEREAYKALIQRLENEQETIQKDNNELRKRLEKAEEIITDREKELKLATHNNDLVQKLETMISMLSEGDKV